MVEPPCLGLAGELLVEGAGRRGQQPLADEPHLGVGKAMEQLVEAAGDRALHPGEVGGAGGRFDGGDAAGGLAQQLKGVLDIAAGALLAVLAAQLRGGGLHGAGEGAGEGSAWRRPCADHPADCLGHPVPADPGE